VIHDSKYWDITAKNTPVGQDFDELMAKQYREVHFNLFSKWVNFDKGGKILKTDLFAEARCPGRAFFWEISKYNCELIGIDISYEICAGARQTSETRNSTQPPVFLACDIRSLPFSNNSFDIVVSDSTLDHYNNISDIEIALREIARVLKPGGTLLITMDNKCNFTEPLFRLWILLGLSPFFIGKTYSIKELKKALYMVGLKVEDNTAIIHNPRFFTKLIVKILRICFPQRSNQNIKNMLDYFDSLEKRRTKYLTAQFIAAKAIKPTE
jgi:ubiquinone/menaquinone biosynthesis C-methylase UbiE